MIKLHIFDMDNTLIEADCDVTWKEFIIESGLAPETDRQLVDSFLKDYEAGCLDDADFNRFQLKEFIGKTPEAMSILAEAHFKAKICSQIRSGALSYLQKLSPEIPKVILSSTNSILVEPVARYLGFSSFFGTELEVKNGSFTGNISGVYMAGAGKVEMAKYFSQLYQIAPEEMAAYGDSVNDLPLLEYIGYPHAINPDSQLEAVALAHRWPIWDWRSILIPDGGNSFFLP